jgi:tetratricopeptide (TPR) repeat protein
VEVNPNNLLIVSCAGVQALHLGDVDEALDYFHRAIRLSPLDPSAHWTLTGIAHAHMILGNYRDAIDWASQSLALNPSYSPTFWMLIAANAWLGDLAEAHRFLQDFRRVAPGVSITSIRAGQPSKDASRIASILDGLRLAGLDEE